MNAELLGHCGNLQARWASKCSSLPPSLTCGRGSCCCNQSSLKKVTTAYRTLRQQHEALAASAGVQPGQLGVEDAFGGSGVPVGAVGSSFPSFMPSLAQQSAEMDDLRRELAQTKRHSRACAKRLAAAEDKIHVRSIVLLSDGF